jgi:hypothetical protein
VRIEAEEEPVPEIDDQDEIHTHVYLLSLWREAANSPWRASLRPAGLDSHTPFPDLETLALYLLALPERLGRPSAIEGETAPYEIQAGDLIATASQRETAQQTRQSKEDDMPPRQMTTSTTVGEEVGGLGVVLLPIGVQTVS